MKTRKTVLLLLGIALTGLTAAKISAQTSFTATYDFGSVVANSGGQTDPSPPPLVADLSPGSFTSVGAASNPNAGGRFSFLNHPIGATNGVDDFSQFTGSLDLAVYFEVTLTPLTLIELQIDSIVFNMRRSTAGVRSYAVRSSVDGFASNLPAVINNGNTNLGVGPANELRWLFDATSTTSDQSGSQINPGASHASLTTPVTFRFYGWNAEPSGGTFSLDNVAFTGSTRGSVPEPTTAVLVALGLAAWSFAQRRSA